MFVSLHPEPVCHIAHLLSTHESRVSMRTHSHASWDSLTLGVAVLAVENLDRSWVLAWSNALFMHLGTRSHTLGPKTLIEYLRASTVSDCVVDYHVVGWSLDSGRSLGVGWD